MSDRMLTIDGVTIALEDKDGQILDRHLAGLNKTIKDQGENVGALKARIAELETALATCQKGTDSKDGEIAVLKKTVEDSKITPDMLDKALEKRMDVVDRATTFFGDQKFQWTGKTDEQIRREVVTARMGEQKTKPMNDDAVEGAFLSLTETENSDGMQRLTRSFSQPPVGSFGDKAAVAYNKRNEQLQNSWRRNKGGAKSA